MTNEEQLMLEEKWIDSLKENKKLKDEISELKLSFSTWIQENAKLKAEIERLKHQIETRIKVSEANFNIYSKLEIERDNLVAEIEQLKSELEQSDSCNNCKHEIDRNEYYCDGCKRISVDCFELKVQV